MVSSFDEAGEIMDRQITHLLGCEGIVCLPVSGATACRGVIVMAADAGRASRLKAEQPMLSLFARQAACALSANAPFSTPHQ
jgi:hypothetical protein